MEQIDIKKLLGLVVICFFFVILLVLFFIPIPAGNSDLIKTFGMALISMGSIVVGYYFGSSAGSARKTDLMAPTPWSGTDMAAGQDKTAAAIVSTEKGFINCRLLLELFLIGTALLMLAACATTSGTSATNNATPLQTAGKSLLAVKSTIVTAATATDALCKAGTLPVDKCTQAKAAYKMSKPAYDAAVDAYLLMSAQGGDAADFGAALVRVQAIASNLLLITGGAK